MKRTLGQGSLAQDRSLWFHILYTVFGVGHADIVFLLLVEVVDIERGYCSPCEAEGIERSLIITADRYFLAQCDFA
eukprot:9056277-Pyramimonas_sp.AAC.1